MFPLEKVSITPTPYQGWDMHPIWEYEANLMDAHWIMTSRRCRLHGLQPLPGEVYWISIIAEVGHKLEVGTTSRAATNSAGCSEDTGKFAQNHYWGWHTSPVHFNDVATMGHLFMPGNQWEYIQWMPIQPQHNLFDMAFELNTIPEPAGATLILFATVAACLMRGRRV